jgi:hypothetical protein
MYLGLGVLFVASVATAMIPRLSAPVRAVTVLPGAAAVVAALFQWLRDQVAHDRDIAMQAAQNSFAIGATSHMANVAFDKHVAFSEEYVAETFNTLRTLFREGPTEQARPHASRLYEIRQKWAVWLTPTIDAKLEAFESVVRKIGAQTHFVNVDVAHPDRARTIREVMSLFKEVMGKHLSESPPDSEHAISAVLQELRAILGIDELTRLRQTFVARSLKNAG